MLFKYLKTICFLDFLQPMVSTCIGLSTFMLTEWYAIRYFFSWAQVIEHRTTIALPSFSSHGMGLCYCEIWTMSFLCCSHKQLSTTEVLHIWSLFFFFFFSILQNVISPLSSGIRTWYAAFCLNKQDFIFHKTENYATKGGAWKSYEYLNTNEANCYINAQEINGKYFNF